MNKECNIVKDLIPLYTDKTASKESEDFITNHCAICEDCSRDLNLALKNIDDEKQEYDDKMSAIWKNIERMDKIRRKKKIIRLIVIIAVFLLFFLLWYCFSLRGNTWFTTINYNKAKNYTFTQSELQSKKIKSKPSMEDIEKAAQAVKDDFWKSKDGCLLLSVDYDEENTLRDYADGHERIDFRSTFYGLFSDWFDGYKESWRWTVQYNKKTDSWEVKYNGYL